MLTFHAAQIAEHGGDAGVRDLGLLESALARQGNAASYDSDAAIPKLAALYALGVIRDHPFIDGNKRADSCYLISWLFRIISSRAHPRCFVAKGSRTRRTARLPWQSLRI